MKFPKTNYSLISCVVLDFIPGSQVHDLICQTFCLHLWKTIYQNCYQKQNKRTTGNSSSILISSNCRSLRSIEGLGTFEEVCPLLRDCIVRTLKISRWHRYFARMPCQLLRQKITMNISGFRGRVPN